MMVKKEFLLAQEELVFLCWLKNCPSVPGLGEKPLGDLTAEQTAAVLATAERTLQARGWLDLLEPGKAVLDPGLNELLQVSLQPEWVIRVVKRKHVEGAMTHFYLQEKLAVKHTSPKPGLHQLVSLDSGTKLDNIIRECIKKKPIVKSISLAMTLAESVVAGARERARTSDLQSARKYLHNNGVNEKQAEQLAQVFSGVVAEIAVIVYKPGQVEPHEDILFFDCCNGLYVLEQDLSEAGLLKVKIQSVDDQELTEKIRLVIAGLSH